MSRRRLFWLVVIESAVLDLCLRWLGRGLTGQRSEASKYRDEALGFA